MGSKKQSSNNLFAFYVLLSKKAFIYISTHPTKYRSACLHALTITVDCFASSIFPAICTQEVELLGAITSLPSLALFLEIKGSGIYGVV